MHKRQLTRLQYVVANAAAMTLIATIVLRPGPVAGHGSHFGSDYANPCDDTAASQCIANDNTHRIMDYGLSGDQITAGMDWTRSSYTDANSDVTLLNTGGCSSATAYCDVLLNDGNYGSTGDWAWTECEFAATHGGNPATHRAWCYPQWLRFNLTYKSNYNTLTRTRAIACHEMGHSLGLRHNSANDSCMHDPPTSPAVPSTQTRPSGWAAPYGHDTNLLRGYYLE